MAVSSVKAYVSVHLTFQCKDFGQDLPYMHALGSSDAVYGWLSFPALLEQSLWRAATFRRQRVLLRKFYPKIYNSFVSLQALSNV